MALHGSLDTFALADVLALLATTGKKGELRVDGGDKSGRLWVDGGKVVGGAAGSATQPVDVLFEMLRLSEGEFDFTAGSEPDSSVTPVAVDALLAEAQSRLGEWRAIEAVVPSLHATVDLCAALDRPEVTISAQEWSAVAAVARAATVHGVMEKLGVGEFEACRTLKGLVEMDLVVVGTAPGLDSLVDAHAEAPQVEDRRGDDAEDLEDLVSIPARKRRGASKQNDVDPAPISEGGEAQARTELDPEEAAQLVKQLTSLTGDEAEAQRAVEAYEKGELENDSDDPINRGLLLKFLSSVRS